MNHHITLNNGHTTPTIGLGTWNSKKEEVTQAVEFGVLQAGYRHIDCASIYGNQLEIGHAFETILTSKKINREDLFVTSKLWNTDHDPDQVKNACIKTLADLKLEYLDLYLMHWGIAFMHGGDLEPLDENGVIKTAPISIEQTWSAMESLVKKGLVKSIGIANFTTTMLIDLLTYADIKPVMNQIELHPYNTQKNLVAFCHSQNIAVTAYSPLGTPGGLREGDPKLLDDEVVCKIAKKHQKTQAQILLNWAVGRKTIPIPKSINHDRLKENIKIYDFTLSSSEMEELDSLDRKYRFVHPIGWWGVPYFD